HLTFFASFNNHVVFNNIVSSAMNKNPPPSCMGHNISSNLCSTGKVIEIDAPGIKRAPPRPVSIVPPISAAVVDIIEPDNIAAFRPVAGTAINGAAVLGLLVDMMHVVIFDYIIVSIKPNADARC